MFSESYLSRTDVTLVGAAIIIIVFAIVITAAVQASNETPTFDKIITVGPVWRTDTWLCTSTEEFMVHGVLIAYADNVGLTIALSGKGTQPDFRFDQGDMKTFSIGGPADSSIRISRSLGILSGFLTLQTSSDAVASCKNI